MTRCPPAHPSSSLLPCSASGAGIFNTDWLGYFVLYFSFSTAYIVSHALVNLMQFITLNVAMENH